VTDTPCARCGVANPPSHRFCTGCGRPLGGDVAGASRFASPGSYTPAHLAEKIRTSRDVLEGERKQVTVLFADMKGSLELLADRDPEDARRVLDPVLAVLMEAVHRYEGTVNQVLGDGVMAIFGAPVAHENHAVRAAYAALRMHDGVRRLARELIRTEGLDMQIRVGLNSGEVVVRSIDNDLHMEYSAVGPTTHLASQMERLARPGSTLLTGETRRLAEGYVTVTPLGPVPVRGSAEPVAVYELTGPGPARYRLQAAAVRGLSRFVGRDAELDQLRHALERVRAGQGRLVALVGEAGVGKSRIIREFVEGPWIADALVLEGRPVAHRKTTSWLPIIDALGRYFRIESRDDARVMREKIAGKILTLDRALDAGLPALLALADQESADPTWRGLDPPQRRRRIQDAVRSLLRVESQRQPVILVVEDLQRIDEETQALLDSLVDRLRGSRLLILVAYRPEYAHRWMTKPDYGQMRIEAFLPETARALLDGLLGRDPALEPLKALLVGRTGGNPLFLEENVRALVETEALVGAPGARRLVRPLESIQVPGSVHAVLAARIDRLTPDAKHVLQSASVLGKDVPLPVLEAIADLPGDALRVALDGLQAAELLYEAAFFPEIEYTFKHVLTLEVAYGGLLHETRRTLHARVVAAIERLYPDRLGEHVERLAHHALRGGLRDRVVGFLRQAGGKAAARSAHREAVGFLEQAMELVDAEGHAAAPPEVAIDLAFELRALLAPLGEFVRTLEHLRRAAERAEVLGDRRRLGWTSSYLTQSHYTLGDQAAAIRSAALALEIGRELGDEPLQIVASFGLGQAHHVLGDHRAAREHLAWAVGAAEGEWSRERWGMAGLVSVASRIWLAATLADVGDFPAAVDRALEGLALAEAADHQWSTAGSYMTLGFVHLSQGHLEEAGPVLDRGVAFSREMDLTAWLPMLLSAQGAAHARGGRLTEGIALLEEGVERAEALRILSRHALRLTWLAEAYLLADRMDEATASARRARELASRHGERGYAAGALRMLGEVSARGGAAERTAAASHYDQALAQARALGMRPLEALCRLGQVALARRSGHHDRARETLAEVTSQLRQMEMRYWLARAE